MKNVKKKSKKQEEKIAKDIGGRTTPASGALWAFKGDVRNDKYLIEAKFTDSNKYQLKCKTWYKIKREAINDGLRIVGKNDVGVNVNNFYINSKLVKNAKKGDIITIKVNDKVEKNDKHKKKISF